MLIKEFTEKLYYSMLSASKTGAAPWYVYAAEEAWKLGRMWLVPQRTDKEKLYFARFWLTKPKKLGGKLESANSNLLHYFAGPDDDGALHCHPWQHFTTTILEGWYDELVPSEFYSDRHNVLYRGPRLDPTDTIKHRRKANQTVVHSGKSMHSVIKIRKHTWTLVKTGPRVDNWGFYPPCKPFVPWREYLNAVQAEE